MLYKRVGLATKAARLEGLKQVRDTRQATHPPLKSLINRWLYDSRKHHTARGDIRPFFQEIHGILTRFFASMLKIMYSWLCKNFRIFGEAKNISSIFYLKKYKKSKKIKNAWKVHFYCWEGSYIPNMIYRKLIVRDKMSLAR